NTTSGTLAFTSANTAGDFIAVVIRASNTNQTFTVSDSRGNTYLRAVQANETVDGTTLAIYYAENIVSGSNTVTVSDAVKGTLRFVILEYAGVAQGTSFDGSSSAQGTSASPSSGSFTTTANGDLVLGMLSTANSATFTAGGGFTIEELVPVAPRTKLAV